MTWNYWLQFSVWHNVAGDQKSEVTDNGYVLIYNGQNVNIFVFTIRLSVALMLVLENNVRVMVFVSVYSEIMWL